MSDAMGDAIKALDTLENIYFNVDGTYRLKDKFQSEVPQIRAALEHAGRGVEPFAYCFTDVNGEAKELCSAPTKDNDPRDMRTITPLYKKPPAPVVPEPLADILRQMVNIHQEKGTVLTVHMNEVAILLDQINAAPEPSNE